MKKIFPALAATLIFGMTSTGFAEEEPEKNSDAVKLSGKIEYTRTQATIAAFGEKEKVTFNEYLFQLNALAKINTHWTANARLEAEHDSDEDKKFKVRLPHFWLEGDYDKFNVKLGKMELLTNENGLIWDTDFSGAQLTFSNRLEYSLMGGRIASRDLEDDVLSEYVIGGSHVKFIGANIQYDEDLGFFGGAGYYRVEGDDFRTKRRVNNLWSVNLGYTFSDIVEISNVYARNLEADDGKYSWHAQLELGNYDDNPEKGDWNFLVGYRQYGTNVSFAPTKEDAVIEGSRGWIIGAAYAPMKNFGVDVKYFKGKDINYGIRVKGFWTKVEYFF